MMTEHEILTRAHRLLSGSGWCQGQPHSYDWGGDTYCLEGVIGQVACGDPQAFIWDDHDAGPVEKLLCGLTSTNDLAGWNDCPGRTKQEVLDLLETAAAITQPETTAGLTGPAIPIIVEPVEKPATTPTPKPEPVREPEKVPAGA